MPEKSRSLVSETKRVAEVYAMHRAVQCKYKRAVPGPHGEAENVFETSDEKPFTGWVKKVSRFPAAQCINNL